MLNRYVQRLTARGLFALLFGVAALSCAYAQPTYRVVEIGALPGDTQSVPHDINDAGEVVGISGANRVFIWSQAKGLLDPKVTVEAPYFFWRQPTTILRINNHGTTVGPNFVRRSTGQVHYRQNVCLPSSSCLVGIGFGGVNENDEVAVTSMTSNSYIPLVFNARTMEYKIDAFNYLWPAYSYSYNNKGMIAGGMFDRRPGTSGAKAEGFLANPFPARITQGQAGVTSESYDINSRGETVGKDGGKPFYYHPQHGLIFISAAQNVVQAGVAHGINEGAVVVGSIGSASNRAFIWTAGTANARYLDDLIDPLDPKSGVIRISSARAINASGQIVALTTENKAVLLMPSIQVVDPVPDLLDGTKTTSNFERLSRGGRTIAAVSADGVTTVLVKIRAQQVGQSFLVQIKSNGCDGGAIGDVCGKLGLVGNSPSSSFITSVAQNTSDGAMAFALYQVPKDFSWKTEHQSLSYRNVDIEISSAGVANIYSIPVVRPPVAFVHGLWSRKGDLGELTNLGGNRNIFSVRELNYGYKVSIENSSPPISSELRERSPARGSSLGIDHAADVVMEQLRDYLEDFRFGTNNFGAQVAAAQVDIVGHSMGALVSRAITYRSDFLLDPVTLGTGYVHKIVSVGGPHKGSPIAAEMNERSNACFLSWSYAGISLIGDGLYTFYDCPTCVSATSSQMPKGKYVGPGAIGDLRGNVDGSGLSQILNSRLTKASANPRPVAYVSARLSDVNEVAFNEPSYVLREIVGIPIKVPNANAPWVKVGAETLCSASTQATLPAKFASAAAFRKFMSQDSDGLVPLKSQLNGIDPLTYGVPAIENTAHSSWTTYLYRTVGDYLVPNSEYGHAAGFVVFGILNTPVTNSIYVVK